MTIDPTGFAKVSLPSVPSVAGSVQKGFAAGQEVLRTGQQIQAGGIALQKALRTEEDESQLRDLGKAFWQAGKDGNPVLQQQILADISAIDPEEGQKMFKLGGQVDRTKMVTAFHHLLAADAFEDDPDAQNKMLMNALNTVGPGNIYHDGLIELMQMPAGVEKNALIIDMIQMGVNMGLSPTMAEAGKAKAASSAEDKKQKYKAAEGIRTKINAQLKDFRVVESGRERVKALYEDARRGSPASQLAMIFNFMKIQDPGSVVRESEFRTAAQAKAFLEKVDNGEIQVNPSAAPGMSLIRQLVFGQKMTENQVNDFRDTAENAYMGTLVAADRRIDEQLQIADQEGVSRERILGSERLKGYRERQDKRKKSARYTPPTIEKGEKIAKGPDGKRYVVRDGQLIDIKTGEPYAN